MLNAQQVNNIVSLRNKIIIKFAKVFLLQYFL